MTTQNLTYRIIGMGGNPEAAKIPRKQRTSEQKGVTEVLRIEDADLIKIGTQFLRLKQERPRVSFRLLAIDNAQTPPREKPLSVNFVRSVVGAARNRKLPARA